MVPFVDLKRFEDGFLERWNAKVSQLSRDASFIGGAEVQQLEQELCNQVGAKYAVTCANGTDALQIALRALGVGDGNVVLIPDMTFWATFEAAVNVGARVATSDIALRDGGIDLQSLETAIDMYSPAAVIVPHLFGWASGHLSEIRRLCCEGNVSLIEDGAQCFGVNFNEEPIYKSALISTTSFYPSKVLGAAGDGGAIFTNDESLATLARQLSNHGRTCHYEHGLVGWNSRLDAFQAAYLNVSMPYLHSKIASRQRTSIAYRERIRNPKIQVMAPPHAFEENGYCNVCLIPDQDYKARLEAHLSEHGIGFGNIYPSPMSSQKASSEYLVGRIGGESALAWCSSVVNLPLFPYLTDDEVSRVINIINNFE